MNNGGTTELFTQAFKRRHEAMCEMNAKVATAYRSYDGETRHLIGISDISNYLARNMTSAVYLALSSKLQELVKKLKREHDIALQLLATAADRTQKVRMENIELALHVLSEYARRLANASKVFANRSTAHAVNGMGMMMTTPHQHNYTAAAAAEASRPAPPPSPPVSSAPQQLMSPTTDALDGQQADDLLADIACLATTTSPNDNRGDAGCTPQQHPSTIEDSINALLGGAAAAAAATTTTTTTPTTTPNVRSFVNGMLGDELYQQMLSLRHLSYD